MGVGTEPLHHKLDAIISNFGIQTGVVHKDLQQTHRL